MTLNDDIKAKIQAEYDSWKDKLWAGKDKAARAKLGQFATPPQLTIKMLEKFDSLEGNVLDPCLGAVNLIAAAIIAGADPNKCYGIELDPTVLKVCRRRLLKYGVPPWHLKEGNALESASYEFEQDNVKTFATVDRLAEAIVLTVVNCNKVIMTKTYTDKDRLKKALKSLKSKDVKIYKI